MFRLLPLTSVAMRSSLPLRTPALCGRPMGGVACWSARPAPSGCGAVLSSMKFYASGSPAGVPSPRSPAFPLLRPSVFRLTEPLRAPPPTALLRQHRSLFSFCRVRQIRVRGRDDASASAGGSTRKDVESPHYPTRFTGDGDGRTMDTLTPYVRQHLLRVYSLMGATAFAAMCGSGLMILTPLSAVVPYWAPMLLELVPLFWLMFAPPANMQLRFALLVSFGFLSGMAIAPLVLMSSLKGVLMTSLVVTAAIFGGFSASAYLAPRASMVAWQGPLFGGLMGLMGLSLFSIFFPSMIAHNIMLYGGLALFSVMIAADTQAMIERARCGAGDPVQDALSMFMNLLNIFVRIMQIMGKD